MPLEEMEFHLLCEKIATKKPNKGILNEDINHMLWDSNTRTSDTTKTLYNRESMKDYEIAKDVLVGEEQNAQILETAVSETMPNWEKTEPQMFQRFCYC